MSCPTRCRTHRRTASERSVRGHRNQPTSGSSRSRTAPATLAIRTPRDGPSTDNQTCTVADQDAGRRLQEVVAGQPDPRNRYVRSLTCQAVRWRFGLVVHLYSADRRTQSGLWINDRICVDVLGDKPRVSPSSTLLLRHGNGGSHPATRQERESDRGKVRQPYPDPEYQQRTRFRIGSATGRMVCNRKSWRNVKCPMRTQDQTQRQ